MKTYENQALPVYILSGFLGSGKTTLLQRLIQHWKESGLRPAVIMNEIGDVNLDGLLVSAEVPMAEMLGGCICCTIRSDLSDEMANLITTEKPDLIVIEATGAANPLEILDAVTETALYMKLEVKPLITVVDSLHLLELNEAQQGKTFRLMQEQIRCASVLVMNKLDLIEGERVKNLETLLQKWNPYAVRIPSVQCQVNLDELLSIHSNPRLTREQQAVSQHEHHHEHHDHGHDHEHNHEHDHEHTHESHEHVMVYTHYFEKPVNSELFEKFVKELPRDIYRGKGVLTFSDTSSRYLFQYAYRESDFLRVTPQGNIPDVAVFIGEHFDKNKLAEALMNIEKLSSQHM